MTQPLAVGSVLGGRYRITEHLVTSADQNLVFLGADQVLNRRVTILVASREDAAQVATSARELATGERQDDVQVLDLGLSEGRTYLIAGGGPDPDVLLGLAYPQEVFVEPFQTDTLGSEIFGEARRGEAHRYEDDEDYYSDLDRQLRADEEQSRRRPGILNRISDRLTERIRPADGTAAKAAAAASALAAADAATRARVEEVKAREEREASEQADAQQAEPRPRDELTQEPDPTESVAVVQADGATDAPTANEAADAPTETQADASETLEDAAATPSTETRAPAPTHPEEPSADTAASWRADVAAATVAATGAEPAPRTRPAPRRALPAFTPLSTTPGTEGGETPAASSGESPDASRAPLTPIASLAPDALPRAAEAAARPAVAPVPDHVHDAEAGSRAEAPEGSGGRSKWLLPLLILLGLLAAVALGFLLLNQNLRAVPAAESSSPAAPPAASSSPASSPAETATSPAESETQSPAESAAPAASSPAATGDASSSETAPAGRPRAAGVARSVPDMPSLEDAHDGELGSLVDGDTSTAWQSYTYTRPNFGGYVASMDLAVALEEPARVNEVVVDHAGGSGGAFTVLLADSPDGENAREVGQGTFDADRAVVPVEADDPAAGHVILRITSLPRLEAGGGERPYGLRLTEVTVR